ncbi:hypothetical protein ACFFGT_31855 [Mucilaginibacter angelicae]|uniref:Uncharacterized protein n=1 Tax=Mucilaginibacter angelicae TaxID=869718 RepID=A0ABV6LH89_9SPHI
MHNEQIRAFLLEYKSRLISLSKSSTQEFIDQVNYLVDRGYLKPNGNSYILTSQGVDFIEEIDKKDLDVRILEHLKNQNAKANKIDIGAPFLLLDDSYDTRLSLWKSLEYLQKEKFIEVDGHPPSLCDTMAGQFGSKYQTGIKASITKLGEKELLPTLESTPVIHAPVNHTYNFEKSQTPIVNSTIQESHLNIDNSLDKQTSINSKLNTPTKASWVETLYWIAGIIVGAILLYEFVIKHLKWV